MSNSPVMAARALILTLGVTLASLAVIAVSGLLMQGIAGVEQWDIPAGHRGWVVARYNWPECPPALSSSFLGLVRGYYVSPTGQMCTSDELRGGWVQLEIDYVGADGGRQRLAVGTPSKGGDVWSMSVDVRGQKQDFFVGTEAEFRQNRTRPTLS